MAHIPQNNNEEGETNKIVLKKIPLYDLLKLIEHLYETGADYIDIIGMSFGEGVQDEIMVAVKDEYMSKKENEEEEEEEEMEGKANIVSREEEDTFEMDEFSKKLQAKITQKDINDLLDI